MRDHSHHIQLTREQAVEQMLALSGFAGTAGDRIERVPVAESAGRVLAADVEARIDVPSALTCVMDSIALHWNDFADLPEGALPDTSKWVRGRDWQFANTGVAMPEGFDTAIVIEHVRVSDDERHVQIDAAPSRKGAGTRPVGAVMHRGEVLGQAGSLITPDLAARLAGGNNATVPVVRKPRVAFIPTGNELIPAGAPFDALRPDTFAGQGRTIETNGILVRAKAEAWGAQFVPLDIVPDEFALIEQAVHHACAAADIVVLNAGSSKGSDDWSVEVLETIGRVICHQTNHGPGHHSSFAIVDGVPVVGISGPSAGASFTLDFYLRPLVRQYLGLEPLVARVPMRLAEPFAAGGPGAHKPQGGAPRGEDRPAEHPTHKPGEPEFFGIKLLRAEHAPDGSLVAHPVPGRPGSPESFTANAYYMLPNGPDITPPAAGDIIMAEWR